MASGAGLTGQKRLFDPEGGAGRDSFIALRRLLSITGCGLFVAAVVAMVAGYELVQVVRGHRIVETQHMLDLERTLLVFALSCATVGLLLLMEAWALRGISCRRGETTGSTKAIRERSPGFAPVVMGLAIGALGLLPFSGALLSRPYTFDEAIEISFDTVGPIWSPLAPRAFANHVSAALIARLGWLFSSDEAGTRLPFLILALAAVGLAGGTAYLLRSRTAAVASACLLVSCHALFVTSAYSIRGYCPLWFGFAALLFIWVLLQGTTMPDGRTVLLVTLSTSVVAALAGSAHLFGAVALVAWLVVGAIFWGMKLRRSPRTFTPEHVFVPGVSLGMVVALVAWSPSIPWLFYQTGNAERATVVKSILPELLRWSGVTGATSWWAAASVLVFTVVASRSAVSRFPSLRLPVFASALFMATCVLCALLFSPTFFFARFLVPALPVLLVAVAMGLLGSRLGVPAVALLATLLAAHLATVVLDQPDPRSAIRALDAIVNRSSADGVTVLGSRTDAAVISYYSRARLSPECKGATLPGADPMDCYYYALEGSNEAALTVSRIESTCQIVAEVGGHQSNFELIAPAASWVCRHRRGVP